MGKGSNGGDPGNAEDRRRRRVWLLETYRADMNVDRDFYQWPLARYIPGGVPACRCYRCGVLLSLETMTVDRIVPGIEGGTYRRSNIRPACSDCQTVTGNALKAKLALVAKR